MRKTIKRKEETSKHTVPMPHGRFGNILAIYKKIRHVHNKVVTKSKELLQLLLNLNKLIKTDEEESDSLINSMRKEVLKGNQNYDKTKIYSDILIKIQSERFFKKFNEAKKKLNDINASLLSAKDELDTFSKMLTVDSLLDHNYLDESSEQLEMCMQKIRTMAKTILKSNTVMRALNANLFVF